VQFLGFSIRIVGVISMFGAYIECLNATDGGPLVFD